ncbi:MAG: ABC transporter [Verrucomicrobia bacterium]|nr:ABC transporter [Verrucomicrobiota bacterium]
MKSGSKFVVIVLLFVALALVNFLASRLPFRGDATAENIYTLSPGTRSIVSKIEEDVVLDFYFSKSVQGLPITYKNYAARVEEMLRQYVRASGGKLKLNVIDPRPDTPEEEKATAAGLQPQQLPSGEAVHFGLVATQADQQKTITSFNPQRESFLEYDLSQLVASVQTVTRKKLGLITSLPLQAPAMDMMMMMQQRQRPTGQMVADEWGRTFELVPIEASATELPGDLDVLAVIHPQGLSNKLQFAIDQFLLGGKPVFLAVDPASQHFKRQGGQAAMFGGAQPNVSSDLPTLLKAYGITYNPQNVAGDLASATQVQTNAGIVRYPVWLTLAQESLNRQAMPVAQLKSTLFVESGSLAIEAGGRTVTPLIETSASGGDVPAFSLQFAQPEEVSRQLVPSGRKTLAAIVSGTFTSAFPNGAPADEPAPGSDAAKAPTPATPPSASALKASSGTSTLLVVADTDWLFDDYSVRRFNFLGVQAAEPLNDNLAFASNSLEFLGGSQDLISIRGKGSSMRPFTVVRRMEVDAQRRYQEQLTALEARITDVQQKLTELQGKRNEGNRLVATPEMQKAIEDFQAQQAVMRGERREIRKALREDIERLENGLLVGNLLAPVLLVGAVGFVVHRRRRR